MMISKLTEVEVQFDNPQCIDSRSELLTLLVSFKRQIPEKTNNLVVVWLVIDKDTKRVRIIVKAILLLRRWCWKFVNDDDH